MPAAPKPDRVAGFTRYVKSLIRLWPAATAAAPIPVTVSGLLPTYFAQQKLLMGLSASFGFLLFLFIFQSRHALARWMFSRTRRKRANTILALAPLLCILLSAGCLFGYIAQLNASLEELAARGVIEPSEVVLRNTDWADVPRAVTLAALYIGVFVFAESAFILIAVREYMQDVLGYSESQLSGARRVAPGDMRTGRRKS